MAYYRDHTLKTRLHFCAMIVLCMMVFASPLNAQVGDPGIFAEKTCDPDYFESLKSRAWLEAQREIVQNQNLIVKPDSVLEYSCFDRQLSVLAYYARSPDGELFSGSSRWGNAGTNMSLALGRLTGQALKAYDEQNFKYDYLGGRMEGVDYKMDRVQGTGPATLIIPNQNYSCDEMDKVWKYAKCMDFINKKHDEFFTFAEHAQDDKRKLPEPCENIAPWGENIQKATGIGVPWERDDLKTYLEYIYPLDTRGCGHANRSKIPTGLIIYNPKSPVNEYRENVCIVPGCYYKPTSINAGTCERPQQ